MKRLHFRRDTAICIACLGLCGCQVGPDFTRPEPPPAHLYTAPPVAVIAPAGDASQQVQMGQRLAGDWWLLFHSEVLDTVVKRALTNNRSLISAAASLEQSQELAAASAGSLYPQFGFTTAVGHQKYGAEFLGTAAKPPPFTYFALGPTVSYALDYTGGVSRSVEQRFALAEYQRQQLEAAYLSVTGNAMMLSLQIASCRDQIATVAEILGQDRDNLHLVQLAFDAGSASRVDIVSAQSQLANDSTLLAPLLQQLSVARHALAIVLGQPPANASPEFELAQLTLPPNLPVSLPSELAHRRPDILAAEAQLHADTAAVGVATANLYPRIDLSASLATQSTHAAGLFGGSSSAGGLASTLTAVLFDGGTLRAQRRAAIAAMRASAAVYDQTVLTAFGQVADSLDAIDHDSEQLSAQSRAQSAARENLDLTRKSYNEGNVGVLQILDAERLYQQARLGYVRANAQRYMDTVQLFLALGGSGPGAFVGQ